MESPGEAGKAGGAVSQLGEVSNDITLEQQGLDLFIKKAQEHVDTLAARNELDEAYANVQNQLLKTQNSRDVPGVIEQGNKTINDIQAQWSQSPAAVAIQMEAESLKPSMGRVGTVRQVDLMGKEFNISLAKQAEPLAADYANDRAMGGTGDMALGAFSTAVMGGVKTGLIGDAEAEEKVRLFRQGGQELQIKNAITNKNPEVNYKIADDATRENFPDVPQAALDTFRGQAMEAAERHTKEAQWIDVQHAMTSTLPAEIQQFTNPATGQFDVGGALKHNAEILADGKRPEWVANALAQQFDSHFTQLQVQVKAEGQKKMAAVDDLLNGAHPNFQAAEQRMAEDKNWFEANDLTPDYMNELRYLHQARAEARAENSNARAEQRYEWQFQREKAEADSTDTFANVTQFINSGGYLTESDIRGLSGTGNGKMETKYVNAAVALKKARDKNPDYAGALNYADSYYGIPKGADPDVVAAQNKKYAQTIMQFQEEVNQHPERSKLEVMQSILKGGHETNVIDWMDRLFGSTPKATPTAPTPPSPAVPKPKAAEPPRPANVPAGYVHKNGPQGVGWYAPTASK